MRRSQGTAITTEPGKRDAVYDTITCGHCQRFERVKPGGVGEIVLLDVGSDGSETAKDGGFCRLCMRFLCSSPACNKECTPFEKALDLEEKRNRFFRGVGI